MAVRKIAEIGHPVLRQKAREISREELATAHMQSFIDDLIDTMRHANGAGLAANQVFEPISICAIEVNDNPRYPYKPKVPLTVLVNPTIEIVSEETFDNYEGCLSVPNLRGIVPRFTRIHVTAWTRDGDPWDERVSGVTAGTFQHEIDHLRGTLFVDRVEDTWTLCTWDEFERQHKAAFAERVRQLVERFGQ